MIGRSGGKFMSITDTIIDNKQTIIDSGNAGLSIKMIATTLARTGKNIDKCLKNLATISSKIDQLKLFGLKDESISSMLGGTGTRAVDIINDLIKNLPNLEKLKNFGYSTKTLVNILRCNKYNIEKVTKKLIDEIDLRADYPTEADCLTEVENNAEDIIKSLVSVSRSNEDAITQNFFEKKSAILELLAKGCKADFLYYFYSQVKNFGFNRAKVEMLSQNKYSSNPDTLSVDELDSKILEEITTGDFNEDAFESTIDFFISEKFSEANSQIEDYQVLGRDSYS